MSLREKILETSKKARLAKQAFYLYDPTWLKGTEQQGITFFFHQYSEETKQVKKKILNRKDALMPPFDPGLFVTHIYSHNIIINKFMQVDGHIVISSDNPKAQQSDHLEKSDFDSFATILDSFQGKGVAYYNCGSNSGASQKHKHIQYAPLSHLNLFDAMTHKKPLPYHYFSINLLNMNEKEINILMNNASKILLKHPSYNFIISNNSALLIPRRKSVKNNFLVNSIGMCGHLGFWPFLDEDILEHPLETITSLCVPV